MTLPQPFVDVGRRPHGIADVVRTIAPPGAGSLDDDAIRRRLVLAAWSFVREPGDHDAIRLIRFLGAERALALLHESEPVRALDGALARLDGHDGTEVAELRGGLAAAVARWGRRSQTDSIVALCRAAVHLGVTFVVPGDAEWPRMLDDLGEHVPIGLWVRGDPSVVVPAADGVAIVGARAASDHGLGVATDLAVGIADTGRTVVSGGAFGIDAAAHRAALAAGRTTIAVMAGGVDRLYPAAHADLLRTIARTGAVVSELPCGQGPRRERFVRRNRIIAALPAATVVVEAGARSGALHTAEFAATMGRGLGAVPGRVTDDGAVGCHRLIREYGAVLVRDVDDVLELVTGEARGPEPFELDGPFG